MAKYVENKYRPTFTERIEQAKRDRANALIKRVEENPGWKPQPGAHYEFTPGKNTKVTYDFGFDKGWDIKELKKLISEDKVKIEHTNSPIEEWCDSWVKKNA